ncbi:DHA2 family efflux MFS transporter permease subunit [uncultured Cytophaga sp.]|uniref:DHA2 family efflux MFS transporter permease subunit n=1 Tax=uncultured Cytophaga sp. TaxID=160238 RepID=UPI0026324CAD|nr:DHA2 family efflux MFS transporter permease subunit [uncultured Cytophaga sp.]
MPLELESLVEYGPRRIIITLTAILCALLEVIDTTIVNVAINEMGGNLGCTIAEVSWVITAYAIGNVIVMPMTSWLSAQFGRRNYFAASIILFTVCSFLCGNATSINELILFRLLQGIGGGALLVTSQTIITESFPAADRGMAQAIYGLGIIVGPTLGPPLGGYLVDNYSWPYIFYINIPIGIVATILTLQFVRSPKYAEKTPIRNVDWWGIILLSVGIGSLQYVLEKGQEEDWFSSNSILICSVLAVFGFFFFIWRESVYKNPIVSFKVLKDFNLKIGTILSFVLGFGLYGSTFIVPLYTQSILGWTALQAGMLMLPASIATGLMMPVMGALLKKGTAPQYLVALGMFLFFIFSFWGYRIISPDTANTDFFWMLIVRGVGLALLFIPITNLALSKLQGQEIGQGAAFTGLMRQLGGSFGIAIINTLITRKTALHRSDIASHLTATDGTSMERINQMQHAFIGQGFSPEIALAKSYKLLDMGISKQAVILSYMDAFLYLGLMFLICVPFVLILLRNNKGNSHVDTSSAH